MTSQIESFEKWWLENREDLMLPVHVKNEALETWQASRTDLVPVGEVSGNDWSMGLLYEDCEPGTPLYMLPKE